MAKNAKHEAAIPNPVLQPLSVLVGEWKTVAKHRLLPDTLHGNTSLEWLEGGAFLMMYSEIDEPGVPSGMAIVGSDDATEEFFMLYFDERGVSRKYEATLRDHVWKLWRNAPGFAQRFTGTFSDHGDTIMGVWELSEDGSTWKRDLELTYTRVKSSRSYALAPKDKTPYLKLALYLEHHLSSSHHDTTLPRQRRREESMRLDGRLNHQLRAITITPNYIESPKAVC